MVNGLLMCGGDLHMTLFPSLAIYRIGGRNPRLWYGLISVVYEGDSARGSTRGRFIVCIEGVWMVCRADGRADQSALGAINRPLLLCQASFGSDASLPNGLRSKMSCDK